jgi:hypothetical protein
VFLAPPRFDLGETLLITILLGIPLGDPDSKNTNIPPIPNVEDY